MNCLHHIQIFFIAYNELTTADYDFTTSSNDNTTYKDFIPEYDYVFIVYNYVSSGYMAFHRLGLLLGKKQQLLIVNIYF